MSGFLRPAAAKISIAHRAFGDRRAHCLKKADIITDADRFLVRHRKRECARKLCAKKASFSGFLYVGWEVSGLYVPLSGAGL